jgi:hypothetical protein
MGVGRRVLRIFFRETGFSKNDFFALAFLFYTFFSLGEKLGNFWNELFPEPRSGSIFKGTNWCGDNLAL